MYSITSRSCVPLENQEIKNGKHSHEEEGVLSGIEAQSKKVNISNSAENEQVNKIDVHAKNFFSIETDLSTLKNQEEEAVKIFDAISEKGWPLVREMLKGNSCIANAKMQVDSKPLEEENLDTRVVWLLARYSQWDLIVEILNQTLKIQFDACPLEGEDAGMTISWLLIFRDQVDLFKEVLKRNSKINVNVCPLRGCHAGKTTLWLLAQDFICDLLLNTLEHHPTANFNASPSKGWYAGASVLWFLAYHQRWDIFKKALSDNPNGNVTIQIPSQH